MRPLLALLMCFAIFAPAGLLRGAQDSSRKLEEVLAKMDAAATGFRSMVADITYTKVTLVVDDKSVEKGVMYFRRERGKRDFKTMIHFREPSEKFVLFKDNNGWIYRPAIAQVEEYDLSRNKEAVEQFLLLGFGTPGADLKKAYTITYGGESKVGSQDTVKLDLVPKSQGMARHIRKIELWLSKDTWQPVQQKFTEPSNDYLITEYSSPKLNASIPDSQFKLEYRGKKPKVVRPQSS